MELESFEKLTLGDLKLLTQLPLFHSVNALASSLGFDSGNLSRRLVRLEELLGCKVINKTRSGYEVTASGLRVLQQINEALSLVRDLPETAGTHDEQPKRRIRLAGRGFLVEWLISTVYPALAQENHPLQFDWMDSSPEASESWARMELVDVLLSLGDVAPGEDWVAAPVGDIAWVPIARLGHPLVGRAGRLSSRDLASFPWVGFSYVEGGLFYRRRGPQSSFVGGRDGCHSQSSRMTILIVNGSDHLAIVPEVALKCWPAPSRPVVLDLDCERRIQTLHLHAHKDRVLAGDFQFLRKVAVQGIRGSA